ncbi:putative bifunctional diguanylate cyclase/phosphodiesterase [Occallatibacter riparius]|uniref:EAL domain-containing protein n=1 Tax=Occallatibacter riparius TaxID=1002689 RepID=A0A9J7BRL0_9BACT|nr:EAL domain-containing protein [Occallatibacter riparius]UWZ83558.1 EAL domain-containing protein [Occallatibacter riparius]
MLFVACVLVAASLTHAARPLTSVRAIRQLSGQDLRSNRPVADVTTLAAAFQSRAPGYHPRFPMHLVEANVRYRGVTGSALDVRLISAPPRLTARRMRAIGAALGVFTILVACWVVVLRRQVRRQMDIIKQDMEAKIALEERYRRTFERNLTGLFTAKPDGTVLDCNDACAHILGFADRAELLAHQDVARQMIRTLSSGNFASDSLVNFEHLFHRADGTWAWALSNVRLVDGAGHPVLEGGVVDISDRKVADDQIRYLAYYDALTGLPNRALLFDRLKLALASARRHGEQLAVLFLDMDWFKHINDSLGHAYGDRLLKMLADRLRTCAREQDTIARLGGDEFLLVINGVDGPADASAVAERLLRRLEQGFEIDGRQLNISCSIGIALFPGHGEDVDTLIKNADAAMYTSKDSGRNCCTLFRPEMTDFALEQLTVENNLRTAIERNELSLVFQPEIDLLTGQPTCCEALLRWHNPELGSVSPDRFIPTAERTGIILPIGEWALRTACREAQAWTGELAHSRVAVNVSEVQLRQANFCNLVRSILNETGLSPQRLELELTESLLVSREGEPRRIMDELRSIGVSFALDDFGTGYSSLGYLRHFPMDKLKIDRAFVRDLPAHREDASIVSALVNMARSLNLNVTAEGVETAEQLAVLRDLGCDQVQGYLLCRPVESHRLIECLQAERSPAVLALSEPAAEALQLAAD